MRPKRQLWWVTATVLSLSAFSFFAGFGLRGLYRQLTASNPGAADILGTRIASAAPRGLDPDLKPGTLYMEVLRKLELYYVEQLPAKTKLALSSVESMLNQLNDPNTRLMSKTEVDAMVGASQGEYAGLGAVLTIRRHAEKVDMGVAAEANPAPAPAPGANPAAPPNPGVKMITVVSVAPGSPAEKAGIRPGDRISELDGHWIAPMHVSYRVLTQLTDPLGPQDGRPRELDEEVDPYKPDPEREKARKEADEARARWKNASDLAAGMEALNGGMQGEHELTLERGNPAQKLKVKVTFGTTTAPTFAHRNLNPTTGYLQFAGINAASVRSAADALAGFQKSGVKNLVVDLRNSPGGSIEAAREIGGLLLGDAKFAVLKVRDADRKLVDQAVMTRPAADRFKPAALTVLVDGGTAGTSELLAAALRDNAGAKLVGSTTFGDGTEQELVRLENGTGMVITRAKMLTSKGGDFDGKGLNPDVKPQGEPLDAALKALTMAAPAAGARS